MLVIASLTLMVRQLAPGTSLAVFVSWFHTALADVAVDIRSPVLGFSVISTITCLIRDGKRQNWLCDFLPYYCKSGI